MTRSKKDQDPVVELLDEQELDAVFGGNTLHSNTPDDERNAIHEVGHAIGFYHEHAGRG